MNATLEEMITGSSGDFEKLTFYGGTVDLIYDKGLHGYYVVENGEKFLVGGATTVCEMIAKPALIQWAANQAIEYLRKKLAENPRLFAPPDIVGPDNAPPWESDAESALNEARFNFRKIKETAADIGTIAHDWLEERNKALIAGDVYNAPLPADDKAASCCVAALDWNIRHNFRPLHAEKKVYSRKLGSAGTFDWVALIDLCGNPGCCPIAKQDVLALGDYKSSKSIWDEYRIQTGFYKAAWQEEFPDQPIEARIVLRLGKEDGEFEPLVMIGEEEFQNDLAAFEGALAIWNWQQQIRLDKRFEKQVEKAQRALAKPKRKPRKPKVKEMEVEDLPILA